MLEGLLDNVNTSKSVYTDAASRSNANEAFLNKHGLISRVAIALANKMVRQI